MEKIVFCECFNVECQIDENIKRESIMKKIEAYEKKSSRVTISHITIDAYNMVNYIADITKTITFLQDD